MAGFRIHLSFVANKPVYEFAQAVQVSGWYNCQFITLGFARDTSCSALKFGPIDPTRPIVIAASYGGSDIGFYVISSHMKSVADKGMFDCKPLRSDVMLIDCNRAPYECSAGGNPYGNTYWAVTVDGETFAQGWQGKLFGPQFAKVWQVDLDRLCAFLGGTYGDRGLHELRAHAARYKRTGGQTDLKMLEDRLRDARHCIGMVLEECRTTVGTMTAKHNEEVAELKREVSRYRVLVSVIQNVLAPLLTRRRPYFGWRAVLQKLMGDIQTAVSNKQ